GGGIEFEKEFKNLTIGKSEVIIDGNDIFILAVGNMVEPAISVAKKISNTNFSCGVVNVRFVKPLDVELIKQIAKKVKGIITIEENIISGGFGSAVCELLETEDVKIHRIGLPDKFVEHGKQTEIRERYGLTTDGIFNNIKEWLKKLA
ncbi:MAG: transketolase C-terminal domain-containing protein, partial [Elusimicrobiota bacterium]